MLKTIAQLASDLGLSQNQVESYGHSKAKLDLALLETRGSRGKYINVTAVNPTPAGEGKTVVAIGLAMALERIRKRTIVTLRQPSLAPVFGMKGGGAGGGNASLFPLEDINLHFTGDLHAIAAANNLLAAMIDNHTLRSLTPNVKPESITWRRVLDMGDKSLSTILTGQGGGVSRTTGFDLTAASEVMAVIALADDRDDLHHRLGRMVVALDGATPVTTDEIGATGSMAALLKDALKPNLVQTCEGTPAMVHAGPFANIAHGNSSVIADRIALSLADFVVTESGFGSDCGAEKFFHIKCRSSGLLPSLEVLVVTVRSVKWHSGLYGNIPTRAIREELQRENLEAVEEGIENLAAHIENLGKFQIPVVVAVNLFPTDTLEERELLLRLTRNLGVEAVAECDVFSKGSEGGVELAEAVVACAAEPKTPHFLYPLEAPLEVKLEALASKIYGANTLQLSPIAKEQVKRYEALGYGELPVCVAKTPFSLSHERTLLGRPKDYSFPIREVRLSAGAGFVYALAGDISTMPGLPKHPNAYNIDIETKGNIVGLF